ncbi:acyl-CoA thioesterase [Fusarium solani]|nr:acyl-CoA thioesterase [Fusarium solani]
MAGNSSLARPEKASSLKQMLELTELSEIGRDHFTNARALWHPPGGRGIFGGAAVALCLTAAHRTVLTEFSIHSLHCYFLSVGDSKIPITFTVQRVRDGKSFATRTVLASQRGKCILTTTMSFMRPASGEVPGMQHSSTMPDWITPPAEDDPNYASASLYAPQVFPVGIQGEEGPPQDQTVRIWIRAPGQISQARDYAAHQIILAYMSDWNFLPCAPIVQKRWKFPEAVSINATRSPLVGTAIGMISTLDHTIYFHEPTKIRADNWTLFEVDSPWTGHDRAIVRGKMFAKDGTLLATCCQEGVIRLRKDIKVEGPRI